MMRKLKWTFFSEHRLLWALTALALIFRLFLMRYRFAVAFDEANYLKLAATAVQHGPAAALHPFWTPLLPWLTAIFGGVIGDFELGGRLLSIFCGVALLPILYFSFQSVTGRVAVLWAVAWAGFAPAFAFHQTGVLTEALYMCVGISGMLLGWRALKQRCWKTAVPAGIAFGLAYLSRPEGIGFIMVYLGVLVLVLGAGLIQNRRLEKALLPVLFGAVMACGLVASPYLLFLRHHTGHWTISGKTANLQGEAYGQVRKADELDIYRVLSEDNHSQLIDKLYHEGTFTAPTESSIDKAVSLTPVYLVKKYVKNLYKVLKEALPTALSTVLFVLVALGLFAVPWSRNRLWRELYFMAFFALFWFVVMPVFHPDERHFLPLLPICFIWAGQGAVHLARWLEHTVEPFFAGRARTVAWSGVCLFVVLGLFLPETGRIVSKQPGGTEYWDSPVEQKAAGLWLRDRLNPGEGIMSRFHTVDYYAGNINIAQSVDIPLNSIERIAEYARFKAVRYLVINERYILDNPNMQGLLDGSECSPAVALIYDRTGPGGLKTVIYEFTRAAETE